MACWMVQGVLALNVSVPGLGKRFMLTKTLEWNLNWCLLDTMLDHNFQIKEEFMHDVKRLQWRFRWRLFPPPPSFTPCAWWQHTDTCSRHTCAGVHAVVIQGKTVANQHCHMQDHGHSESAGGALCSGVPADLLLHAQRGEVLPPALLGRGAPLVRPGRLAPP